MQQRKIGSQLEEEEDLHRTLVLERESLKNPSMATAKERERDFDQNHSRTQSKPENNHPPPPSSSCSDDEEEDDSDSAIKTELRNLKTELEQTKQNLGVLKKELKRAMEAEENSKRAMDDLALALKEVATEANKTKADYVTSQEELKKVKEERENVKKSEEKLRGEVKEARREADVFKSTVERLRLEAEESVLAWSGRETSLVVCIRRAEEDRYVAQQENRRLMDTLRLSELKNMTSKEEIKKLRDIMKQALNEANVAKEAAGIAQEENSQLKDCLAEKKNALDFLGTENETLKVSQAAAMEEILQLKHLLEESSKKEQETKPETDHEQIKVEVKAPKVEIESIGMRLGKAFTFSFMEMRNGGGEKKKVEEEEEEEPEMEETLKGSIFDENVDSPGTPAPAREFHRRKGSAVGEMMNEEEEEERDDMEELGHYDEMESERNSRKKKALMRRFGDLLMRRRSFSKKELSPE